MKQLQTKMKLMVRWIVFAVFLIVQASSQHQFSILNKCQYTVWAGALGNGWLPSNGGFQLNPGQSADFSFPDAWSGRVWGRTECDSSGRCVTGDCGGLQCSGRGGQPPATLAEFTLDSPFDFYDVSLVDGYNLPLKVIPTNGTFVRRDPNNAYDCGIPGCTTDLNAICPSELKVIGPKGNVVACMSACEKFNTDEYCCRGAHGTPDTCKSTDWPVNYPAIFKKACPTAYSYAYDDTTSTFTCQSAPSKWTGYTIAFCG